MFTYQILRLDEASFKFKIESGEFAGKTLKSRYVEPCMDLTCTCGNLYFTDHSEQLYALDVEDHCVIKYVDDDAIDGENDPFVASLENEISNKQWEELEEFYKNLKGMASEVVDADKLELEFEDYHDKLAGLQMAGYFEVLPWCFDLSIEVDGIKYFFVDFYCVKPNCDCSAIMLYLAKDLDEEPELELWFDYETNEVEIGDINTRKFPVARIIREFKYTQYEKYKGILSNRHKRMKTFFMDFIDREGIKPIVQSPITKQITIGRNDPCPCGSGKKYKKCCGA